MHLLLHHFDMVQCILHNKAILTSSVGYYALVSMNDLQAATHYDTLIFSDRYVTLFRKRFAVCAPRKERVLQYVPLIRKGFAVYAPRKEGLCCVYMPLTGESLALCAAHKEELSTVCAHDKGRFCSMQPS